MPVYNAMFQEQANRFYFEDDKTFVNVGNAYDHDCLNSYDGILGMIPCICVFEKKGDYIKIISNNEIWKLYEPDIVVNLKTIEIPLWDSGKREFYKIKRLTYLDEAKGVFLDNQQRAWSFRTYKYRIEFKILYEQMIPLYQKISMLNGIINKLTNDFNFDETPKYVSQLNEVEKEYDKLSEKMEYMLEDLNDGARSSLLNYYVTDGIIKIRTVDGEKIQDGELTITSEQVIITKIPKYINFDIINKGIIYNYFKSTSSGRLNYTNGIMKGRYLSVGNIILKDMLTTSAFTFDNNDDYVMRKTLRINDYREIEKRDINDIFYINNKGVQLPIIKEIDYYDGWFDKDDTLFINLAQVGVYPLN